MPYRDVSPFFESFVVKKQDFADVFMTLFQRKESMLFSHPVAANVYSFASNPP